MKREQPTPQFPGQLTDSFVRFNARGARLHAGLARLTNSSDHLERAFACGNYIASLLVLEKQQMHLSPAGNRCDFL